MNPTCAQLPFQLDPTIAPLCVEVGVYIEAPVSLS